MTTTAVPAVACELIHPTLTVADVPAAVAFYTQKLGFTPSFKAGDPPRYAGVQLDKVELHLGQGTPNPAFGSVYFVVGDVDQLYALQVANGVAIVDPPADQEWGLREYETRDLDGYRLRFGQHLPARQPELVIERVDLPVRLEKRLAALLADLAAHKRMTIGECLEETLLHSFETAGPGAVASPHTEGTLRHIEALKAKHGLDYETHASYRFTEKP
jgi:catechol 2,3-dioxygenase-like lactoylglutathione lyase family enzyme